MSMGKNYNGLLSEWMHVKLWFDRLKLTYWRTEVFTKEVGRSRRWPGPSVRADHPHTAGSKQEKKLSF